mmetsp:Transcript_72045/g.220529  ORF Transcript_72045/g.220529 Transcript_72045/m.220529 type:complete len:279 (-) Transcript_72045:230-1066(-)
MLPHAVAAKDEELVAAADFDLQRVRLVGQADAGAPEVADGPRHVQHRAIPALFVDPVRAAVERDGPIGLRDPLSLRRHVGLVVRRQVLGLIILPTGNGAAAVADVRHGQHVLAVVVHDDGGRGARLGRLARDGGALLGQRCGNFVERFRHDSLHRRRAQAFVLQDKSRQPLLHVVGNVVAARPMAVEDPVHRVAGGVPLDAPGVLVGRVLVPLDARGLDALRGVGVRLAVIALDEGLRAVGASQPAARGRCRRPDRNQGRRRLRRVRVLRRDATRISA